MKELHPRKSEGGTRVVKLMYKNRSSALHEGGAKHEGCHWVPAHHLLD